ncbi:Transposon Ty3-G Gag-Pol polyprotein [Araneus ventricosus]|uniref:Transposon Ty3-G Gag-Pol polyprotein n=1 Tax=Araneus ventricosus TaxID=182803 RepID=A0A4Y2F0K8_ARAVE|nr:Transposon Ty3-G Gag-Pol polyprotein [Araneus ventricosus]
MAAPKPMYGVSMLQYGSCRLNVTSLLKSDLEYLSQGEDDEYDVGTLRVEPHRIVRNSDFSVSLRPYHTSLVEEQEIKSQVEKLLQAGLIKESNSPYSSPVTLTFKRDEGKKTRLCIDFRKLNALGKSDSETFPLMDSLPDKLSKANIFSSLDLASGYWHEPINPKDTKQLLSAQSLTSMRHADYHLALK